MRTVSNQALHPKWAPLADETFDRLYDAYCAWCASTPVERAQLAHDAAQRRYNAFVYSVPYDDEISIFERPEWKKLAAELVDAFHVLKHAEARDRIPLPSVPDPVVSEVRRGFGGYTVPCRTKFRRA